MQCGPANPECFYVATEDGALQCAKHLTKHVCGPKHCTAHVTDVAGTKRCRISGLVFTYGECSSDGTSLAPPSTVKAPGARALSASHVPGASMPPSVRTEDAFRRSGDNARESIENVVRESIPPSAFPRRKGVAQTPTPAEHHEAYAHEIYRVWCLLQNRQRASAPAVHAIGCLMLMAKGICVEGREADALLNRGLITPGPDSKLLQTGDVTTGKNLTHSAMGSDVLFKPHAVVLEEVRLAKTQKDMARARGEVVSLRAVPELPASSLPCRELCVPYRVLTQSPNP